MAATQNIQNLCGAQKWCMLKTFLGNRTLSGINSARLMFHFQNLFSKSSIAYYCRKSCFFSGKNNQSKMQFKKPRDPLWNIKILVPALPYFRPNLTYAYHSIILVPIVYKSPRGPMPPACSDIIDDIPNFMIWQWLDWKCVKLVKVLRDLVSHIKYDADINCECVPFTKKYLVNSWA